MKTSEVLKDAGACLPAVTYIAMLELRGVNDLSQLWAASPHSMRCWMHYQYGVKVECPEPLTDATLSAMLDVARNLPNHNLTYQQLAIVLMTDEGCHPMVQDILRNRKF